MSSLISNNPANIQDNDGHTAVHYAVESQKNENILRLLLEHRVNVDMPDQFGKTPLHSAVEKHHGSLVSLLLQHNADVNIQDNHRTAPVDVAKNLSKDQKELRALVLNAQHEQRKKQASILEEKRLPLVLSTAAIREQNIDSKNKK
jgi:ankyrin repeat protein